MPNLTPTERQAISRFSRRVQAEFGDQLDSIQIFGSKARGDDHRHSDVDLLVVMTEVDWREEKRIDYLASQVMSATGVFLSPKVFTVETIDRMKRHHNMFWQSIQPDLQTI